MHIQTSSNNNNNEIVDEMKSFDIVLLLELNLQIFFYSVRGEKFLIKAKDKLYEKKNRR